MVLERKADPPDTVAKLLHEYHHEVLLRSVPVHRFELLNENEILNRRNDDRESKFEDIIGARASLGIRGI